METYIVDCETVLSSINTLAAFFQTDKDKIKNFLESIDLSILFTEESKREFLDERDYLFKLFLEEFNYTSTYLQAYWFHASRVKKGTDFKEGLLPLKDMIPKTEKFLDKMASLNNICGNGNSLDSSYRINNKLSNQNDLGPFGFLNKEVAINPPSSFHNYHELPELVVDIIDHKYSDYRNKLINIYIKETVPCIVKFLTDQCFFYENFDYVLYYLYRKSKFLPLNEDCSTNISNRGSIIPFENIIKVEFLH